MFARLCTVIRLLTDLDGVGKSDLPMCLPSGILKQWCSVSKILGMRRHASTGLGFAAHPQLHGHTTQVTFGPIYPTCCSDWVSGHLNDTVSCCTHTCKATRVCRYAAMPYHNVGIGPRLTIDDLVSWSPVSYNPADEVTKCPFAGTCFGQGQRCVFPSSQGCFLNNMLFSWIAHCLYTHTIASITHI